MSTTRRLVLAVSTATFALLVPTGAALAAETAPTTQPKPPPPPPDNNCIKVPGGGWLCQRD